MDLLHILPIRGPSTQVNDTLDCESCTDISVYEDRDEMDISFNSTNDQIDCNSNYSMDKSNNEVSFSPIYTLNNSYNNNNNQNNGNDVESQKPVNIHRRKSLISKLYFNNSSRKKRVSTRLSILGKTLTSYHTKDDISFYKERLAVYNFLQRPQGCVAISYHIFVSCVVFICLILTVFSTISEYENYATEGLTFMDSLVVALFSSEFLARLWSSSCISHYQGWKGKFRFIRNPFRIIDVLVILTSSIVLFFDTTNFTFSAYFRGFRFFQVFQMLRLEHRFRPWKLMASVVWAQREHLAITSYMGFLSLLFISFLIYFVEKDSNKAFDSLGASLWWSVVTLCTVGYGDMTPVTPVGKFLSCICIIMGVSIFALPAGILGTGLALKVQEQQRQRQMGKRRAPAARLIQCAWRYYASSENSRSTVTWKLHLYPFSRFYALSNLERNAIRFVRAVKYLIARRNFNRAFKPYDIKDVLEQYAAGHADVLGRVKHMQSRLNTVQSSVITNFNSLQESKSSLTTRMAHIDSIASDMQIKFNEFMAIQLRDKHIIEALTSIMSSKTDFCDNSMTSSVPQKHRRKSF